jgi:hypothetical protein
MKKLYTFLKYSISAILIIAPLQLAQTSFKHSDFLYDNSLDNYSNLDQSGLKFNFENQKAPVYKQQEGKLSLAKKPSGLSLNTEVAKNINLYPDEFQPWESKKHFWVGVGEIALLEFLPWAMARWVRDWENPEDNWAKVTPDSWWSNLSKGWEYDGDNFTTNNYAHPYHGALFFNAGRTNGYDFWESTVWALTGSAIWEFFGETFRPSFNDWIYTGVGGSNYGEILYRLSSLVTDNRATGSERFFSELWGTILNPVRGFNRAISGEMGQNFDNPKWSRPDDFRLELTAGTRTLDQNGDKQFRENELEGLFTLDIYYGNPFKAKKPFEFFRFDVGFSSGVPHFAQLNSSGYLFGFNLKKNRHKFNVSLDFLYNNLIREQTSETDTVYKGLVFGTTQLFPHILSNFPIGSKTSIVTQVGVNAILMGATRNDYYVDVEGRLNDFGPGVGLRLHGALRSNNWDWVRLFYYGAWLFTQSEPGDSKHNAHFFLVEFQYPFTSFFSIGLRGGVFWRESYYDDFPDVSRNHPMIRVFFKTRLVSF